MIELLKFFPKDIDIQKEVKAIKDIDSEYVIKILEVDEEKIVLLMKKFLHYEK